MSYAINMIFLLLCDTTEIFHQILFCMAFIKHVFAISIFCVESDWRVCGSGCFMCSSCRYQTVFTNRCLQTLMNVDDILIALFSLKTEVYFCLRVMTRKSCAQFSTQFNCWYSHEWRYLLHPVKTNPVT